MVKVRCFDRTFAIRINSTFFEKEYVESRAIDLKIEIQVTLTVLKSLKSLIRISGSKLFVQNLSQVSMFNTRDTTIFRFT